MYSRREKSHHTQPGGRHGPLKAGAPVKLTTVGSSSIWVLELRFISYFMLSYSLDSRPDVRRGLGVVFGRPGPGRKTPYLL